MLVTSTDAWDQHPDARARILEAVEIEQAHEEAGQAGVDAAAGLRR